jgi:hypothetical protein
VPDERTSLYSHLLKALLTCTLFHVKHSLSIAIEIEGAIAEPDLWSSDLIEHNSIRSGLRYWRFLSKGAFFTDKTL